MPQAIIRPEVATGRQGSLFSGDLISRRNEITAVVAGKRVLAIGAAGSIGSATIATLSDYGPEALHVVDQNENALAELVRQFRSRAEPFNVTDFRTLPLDYGSVAMHAFLLDQAPYDLILNFAAIKHVRSEKDPFSTLQMFDTNIIKQHRFIRWLSGINFSGRYFSVSTDKAANPSSLMGATKRVMEHVMFDTQVSQAAFTVTSARFANVAFSNGSLLESFTRRFGANQPLAVPKDIRRYFVSLSESGEICTLAAVLAPDRFIAIPRLDPKQHLVLLSDVAKDFLEDNGYMAAIYDDELRARHSVDAEMRKGCWPLLLTKGNTAGEKPYEEFVAHGETASEIGFNGMLGVAYVPAVGSVSAMMSELSAFVRTLDNDEPTLTIGVLKEFISQLEPAFLETHVHSELNLDQRL